MGVLAAAAAIAALVTFHGQPAVRKGSITTRWRESGDIVERCASCHEGPHPAAAADVIAIHPIESYGCVACHGGTPGAGDLRAHEGLLKNDGDVELREAACGRCHASEEKLTHAGKDLAPHLAKGRAIYESRCAPCHDANASHDRALPVSWISSAVSLDWALDHVAQEQASAPELDGLQARRDLVAWLWSKGENRARGFAEVTGASKEEGAELYTAYGCAACHGPASSFEFPASDHPDFVAYYIQNPRRVWASAQMPDFRLTRREAASLAKLLSTTPAPDDDLKKLETMPTRESLPKCSDANDVVLPAAECGQKIATKLGCGTCHQDAGPPAKASDLALWTSEPITPEKIQHAKDAMNWPQHHRAIVDPADLPDVLVALAAKTNVHLVPKFDPSHAPYFETVRGDELLEDRGCLKCHSRTSRELLHIGNFDVHAATPSLVGEGAKVQPEWLLAFFRDPEANGVRPWLHPEWVWGELVPQDKMAVRMPSYALTNEETTAIVRALAIEDGGDYPYSNPQTPSLSSSDIVSALVHVNGDADNGGACMKCHYVGPLPTDRAKTNLEMLAPDLGRVASRLRPKYVSELLAHPEDLVNGMPALWKDPAGPALAWTIPTDAEPKKTAADQIALTTSFLFLLRDDTRLPRVGDETKTPILGLSRTHFP